MAWESSGAKRHDFTPFSEYSRFSDDTVMTLAVAHVLLEGGSYATALREFGRRYAHGFSLHAGVRLAPPINARRLSTCAATSPARPSPTSGSV